MDRLPAGVLTRPASPGSHNDVLGPALPAPAVALLVAAAADGGKLLAGAVVTLAVVGPRAHRAGYAPAGTLTRSPHRTSASS
ncbi:hypothetical protein [Streptomyces sp. CNQ085]|uniref:hypothetical protein n=1 Tax=Streptomyces sp. CNQ085 TaxID=2886944 RepID=UPI001F51030B|nr:hypothetical protein [Streptomyces sp. CNQ085]MCI0384910.1 hypothetical protein [Streptomyces sp. CNQ085]